MASIDRLFRCRRQVLGDHRRHRLAEQLTALRHKMDTVSRHQPGTRLGIRQDGVQVALPDKSFSTVVA